MGSNQYNTNSSWSSNQYDTGQNRHIEPGAAFLGEIFLLYSCDMCEHCFYTIQSATVFYVGQYIYNRLWDVTISTFAGPRLWDKPISLPFQLFPSDSQQQQQQQDVSKQQSIFSQQQQQQSGFNQQQSYSQGNFCSQQNCNQQMSFPAQNNNRGDNQDQKIEELNQMFWRTSLKN